jgi:hypothetical protein
MKIVTLPVFLFGILLVSGQPSTVQGQPTDASKSAWSDAWSFANSLTVMDNFRRMYVPHASALLEAEQILARDSVSSRFQRDLEALPGVGGWFWATANEFHSSDSTLHPDQVREFLFNRREATAKYESPMMHRKVGGQVHFMRMRLGDVVYGMMVRYIVTKPNLPPSGFITLILDRDWLVRRIPSEMDSLAHESQQLLFWAPSARNSLVEQSLGIIQGGDTLWWSGRKDVKVTNIQAILPFSEIEIHSFVRKQ